MPSKAYITSDFQLSLGTIKAATVPYTGFRNLIDLVLSRSGNQVELMNSIL